MNAHFIRPRSDQVVRELVADVVYRSILANRQYTLQTSNVNLKALIHEAEQFHLFVNLDDCDNNIRVQILDSQ